MSGLNQTKGRSCDGKQSFTKLQAQAACDQRWRVAMVNVVPYHCRFCGGWHIGHPIGSRRKR